MNIGNQGRLQMLEHGPRVTWNPLRNLQATVETFTRVGWSSETEMNGTSNNYSPLFARKRLVTRGLSIAESMTFPPAS